MPFCCAAVRRAPLPPLWPLPNPNHDLIMQASNVASLGPGVLSLYTVAPSPDGAVLFQDLKGVVPLGVLPSQIAVMAATQAPFFSPRGANEFQVVHRPLSE